MGSKVVVSLLFMSMQLLAGEQPGMSHEKHNEYYKKTTAVEHQDMLQTLRVIQTQSNSFIRQSNRPGNVLVRS